MRKLLPLLAALLPAISHASFLHGEALDNMADVVSWIVLIVLPIGGIYLFWMVHILPEKIAHDNHHPQKEAIHMLCMLSLVFGGLLWPLAFLWAKTKPVGYKLAYGTDKHPDALIEEELVEEIHQDSEEIERLRAELETLKQQLKRDGDA
ncbi:DUF3302 domain-containing protein [Chitinibacteraceae bacterium HSL-7]